MLLECCMCKTVFINKTHIKYCSVDCRGNSRLRLSAFSNRKDIALVLNESESEGGRESLKVESNET